VHGLDLNLLPVLHALLEEQHVTRAAERVHLSVPATSRALERCRRAFGDPLLVRSGRGVVITPRGAELLAELNPILAAVSGLVDRGAPFDPASLRRRFTVRANEAVIASLGSPLLDVLRAQAPHVDVRFQFEADDDDARLRDGSVDLAIGGYSDLDADLSTEAIAAETLVGVARAGVVPAGARMTLKRFASIDHVVSSRRGRATGPLDALLAERGLHRRVVAVVPSFSAALAMVAQTDALTIAPRRLVEILAAEGHLEVFRIPLELPEVEVVQVWHRRTAADPAHRWFRSCVRSAAATR
jgi:DNA-binding transcriptional LysR family regulator